MLEGLNEGHRARTLDLTDEERAAVYDLHLLTMKPILYVANVDEDQVTADLAEIDGCAPVPISAKIEADLADMDAEDAAMFLEEMGLEESGLARLAREAYALLGLQSYFTSGEKETKAWTIPIGAKAPQAAGVIHTDFERGFIKAETASYEDYVALGGEKGCREAGKLRQEGQGIRRPGRRRHALQVQRVGKKKVLDLLDSAKYIIQALFARARSSVG